MHWLAPLNTVYSLFALYWLEVWQLLGTVVNSEPGNEWLLCMVKQVFNGFKNTGNPVVFVFTI